MPKKNFLVLLISESRGVDWVYDRPNLLSPTVITSKSYIKQTTLTPDHVNVKLCTRGNWTVQVVFIIASLPEFLVRKFLKF